MRGNRRTYVTCPKCGKEVVDGMGYRIHVKTCEGKKPTPNKLRSIKRGV